MGIFRYFIIAAAIVLMVYYGFKTVSDGTTNYSDPKIYMVPIALIVVISLSIMRILMENKKK
jgi:hypothetical protein